MANRRFDISNFQFIIANQRFDIPAAISKIPFGEARRGEPQPLGTETLKSFRP